MAASYDRTPLPTARELHMLNRMGCGFTRPELTRLRKAGGPVPWFEAQLRPEHAAPALRQGKRVSEGPKTARQAPSPRGSTRAKVLRFPIRLSLFAGENRGKQLLKLAEA